MVCLEVFPKVVDKLSRLCHYGRQIITKIKDEHEHKQLKIVSYEDEMNASKLCKSLLDETLREGAQKLLKEAIENEVEEYIQAHQNAVDDNGNRLVVRNGRHRRRGIQTGVGIVEIEQPRVHDKRPDNSFSSSILPKYMRRCPSLDATVAALYLKGVSTSSMVEALEPILVRRHWDYPAAMSPEVDSNCSKYTN